MQSDENAVMAKNNVSFGTFYLCIYLQKTIYENNKAHYKNINIVYLDETPQVLRIFSAKHG